MIDTILKNTKTMLMIADNSNDELLTLLVETAIQESKNICNRSDLPKELWFLVSQIAANTFRTLKRANDKEISSISESGRTVSFSVGAAQTQIIDQLAKMEQLKKYRKLYYE